MPRPKITVTTEIPTGHPRTITVFPLTPACLQENIEALAELLGVSAEGLRAEFKAEGSEVYRGVFATNVRRRGRFLLIGIGENGGKGGAFSSGNAAGRALREAKTENLIVDFTVAERFRNGAGTPEVAEGLIEGLCFGLHVQTRFRTDRLRPDQRKTDGPSAVDEITVVSPSDMETELSEAGRRAGIVADAQNLARDLVDAPSNRMTPTDLAHVAVDSGRKYGYDVHVLWKSDIEAAGLHALLAVNRGSSEPPTFTVMEYRPETAREVPAIALVGKGVTFDTGGISLKRSENLHLMKSDMGGAAAVICTVEAVARLNLPVHLIGAIPATDNKTGSSAQNPGDIIETYAGITVEVEDTDAEGRLIVADAIAYLCDKHQPDAVIDVATLTGAVVHALGHHCAGVFSNNDELSAALLDAGNQSGERVWRLPTWEVYDRQIKSDLADIKNLGGRPAGAITAAKFIEKFVSEGTPWAHIDMAGTVLTSENATAQRSASGWGVRLLVEWLARQV